MPISISPAAIARATPSTASRPEPQTLLTVTHGTLFGRPAKSAAWRAGAWPTPAWSTSPMWTSWMSPGASPARSSAALIATAPSLGAGSDDRDPRKLPMAVRAAPTMTTSRMVRAYRAGARNVNPYDSAMLPSAIDDFRQEADDRVDLGFGRAPSQREPDGFARLIRRRPSASNTGDGSMLPLVHAAPVDAATPARSSAITIASPRAPGNAALIVPPVRAAVYP